MGCVVCSGPRGGWRVSDTGRPISGSTRETYRLVTTIRDPADAPADELAALYSQRWEHETLPDEIKVHQQDNRLVLRSRLPLRVEQEVWASSPYTGHCGN